MNSYFMLGKYSAESLKNISPERTGKVRDAVTKTGGKVDEIHLLLGEYDIIMKVQFPGTGEAMKASVELGKRFGISFSTMPSLSAEEFDKII